ncbi:GGDEF domain-containing protein [Deinococcus navajonensis]|uniref:GGDEF domain-containing protein n=1 Tax=Deinococcus navajonensis TaxID=309884 RepID=A0ABV8XPN2_9DEIO
MPIPWSAEADLFFDALPVPAVWARLGQPTRQNPAWAARFESPAADLWGAEPGELRSLRCLDGSSRLCRVQRRELPDGQGVLYLVEDLHDFSVDALTGLPGRAALQQDARRGLPSGSVLLLDINQFKLINDTRGHAAGDLALRVLGQLLALAAPGLAAKAYRWGGDEFVLVSPETLRAPDLDPLQRRFRARLRTELGLRGASFAFGVAQAPTHGAELCSLLRHADHEMYRHKHGNRQADRPAAWGPPAGGARLRLA